MSPNSRKFITGLIALLFVVEVSAPPSSFSQSAPPPPKAQSAPRRGGFRFRVDSNMVLVNVVARDKQGNLIRGMTKDDFQLLEDGKQQSIADFGFEDVDAIALGAQNAPTVSGLAGAPAAPPPDPQSP